MQLQIHALHVNLHSENLYHENAGESRNLVRGHEIKQDASFKNLPDVSFISTGSQ